MEINRAIRDTRRAGALLGGDSFAQLNLEYQLLLGGPFRLLVLGDAANVLGEGQPFDLSNLRTTAGLEFCALLPVFGAHHPHLCQKTSDPRPQNDFEEFFSIGTSLIRAKAIPPATMLGILHHP